MLIEIYHYSDVLIGQFKQNVIHMILILDGKPEIGSHLRYNLCYGICLRHLLI